VNWLQAALCAVWWFHPVVWLVSRMMSKVREDCCDDFLLAQSVTTPDGYCDTLLVVARNMRNAVAVGAGVGMSERLHPLGRRLSRIMRSPLPPRSGLSAAGCVVLVVAAVVLLPGVRYGAAAVGSDQPETPASAPQAPPAAPAQASLAPTPADEPPSESRAPADQEPSETQADLQSKLQALITSLNSGDKEASATAGTSPESSAGKSSTASPHQLYLLSADGSQRLPLVSMSTYTAHGSPAWSPDGTMIAFDAWRAESGESYGKSHVFVMQADGSGLRDLGDGAMPSWSPDATRITFSRYSPNRGVWIMNADGTGMELLDAEGWSAAWSPAGDEIAYTVYDGGPNFCIHNLVKRTRRLIPVPGRRQIYWGFTWSPGGDRLCFKGVRDDESHEIAVVGTDLANSQVKVLCTGPASHDLAWSPDGLQVLASMSKRGDGNAQLYVLDPNSGKPPRLLEGKPSAWRTVQMSWSPDGRRIVAAASPPKGPPSATAPGR
jgi:Tol biopolymer transport system component